MAWFISLFSSGLGSIIFKLLPYILGLLLAVGSYFYGHHSATVACHEKELQAVIDTQNTKMAELEQQFKDAQNVIAALTKQNGKINDITKTISDKIGKLSNPKDCTVNKDVIDLINQARSGVTK